MTWLRPSGWLAAELGCKLSQSECRTAVPHSARMQTSRAGCTRGTAQGSHKGETTSSWGAGTALQEVASELDLEG